MKAKLTTLKAFALLLAFAVITSPAALLAAEGDPVDLTDEVGVVNVTGHINALVQVLGTIVATVVGAYFTFKIVKMALRWVGRAGG